MVNPIRRFFGREYHPLNKIEISKKNLISNYRYLNSLNKKVKVVPVLKSNGYGHGIIQVAQILDPLKPPFICVDSIFEAYQLLKSVIKTKILIMGYIDPVNLRIKKLPFSYAVWDLEIVNFLNKYQPNCEIHIFVDTGMNREGVSIDQLEDFLISLKEFKNLRIVGLMSHLSSNNSIQVRNFQKAIRICQKNKLKIKYTHLANSAGHIKNFNKDSNISRVGLALYGIDPLKENLKLKPVLEFKTHLVQIKEVKKGERIGYDETYLAKKDMTVGILPVGYNDGLDRRLSNKGVVTISGINCSIIGLVSMNVTVIDLSDVMYPKVGDEIVIYSDDPKDKNSIQNTAKICQTIPYDILVNLTPTTRREVV